jgi:hypothetical protein
MSGELKYWRVKEIKKGMEDCGLYNGCAGANVWAAVAALEAWGYLEVQKDGGLREFYRVVRLKARYCR